ncbi:putative BEACH domain, concanavalin A-like lectin/glucanase domain superfamily, PH-BEACH [Plasmopara halstedii]
MEQLRMLLQDAEAAHLRTQQAIADNLAQVSHLKDSVLLLLDVLGRCETIEARHETLEVLRRLFAECSKYFHDVQFLQETNDDATESQHVVKRGNVILKALLSTLHTLSCQIGVESETFQILTDMVRILCLQTMNTPDVVALFDFLRLGRPPARRWVLQMQKTLLEMDTIPRAIFTMRGPNAGLVIPSDVQLVTKKGYSCSFGIHIEATAAAVALYSFRGLNGQGVSAILSGNILLVKSVGVHGAVQQAEVPFVEYAEKMQKEWMHLCIVHAKNIVFKDKLTVYVDGVNIFCGNLGYPDPVAMVGGRNTIGIEPLVGGLQGKIWSPTLFGVPLSETGVQRLHWLTHWKYDLNSITAESLNHSDKFKLCFSYDARSCDLNKRICYDVSGNDHHGSLGPGTNAVVTQSFIHALDSIGGCACFLLLLLDQIPEMANFHPTKEFEIEEISDLLAFVGSGLHQSTVCRSHFVRLHGVNVVEFILQSISPNCLSVSILNGVISILDAMVDFSKTQGELVEYIYRLMFFNTNWFLSPYDTQVKLLGEVLPRYLQILRKTSLQEKSCCSDIVSIPRAASLSDFSRFSNIKDQASVGFFCRLIAQNYVVSPSDNYKSNQMNAEQLAQLRELILCRLIDPLLFPVFEDTATDQWRQLMAYLFRQCQSSSTKHPRDRDAADIIHILQYLTQNLASSEACKGAVSLPSRQLQVTTNINHLSKGTMRAFWRPMLSSNYNVRLNALRLFELYTSERSLLQKHDMLMLYSSLQAHTLTADIADLLLDIVIGRKRMPHKFSDEVRIGSLERMNYIPLVLINLIHCGGFDVQAYVLAEIRVQLASSAMGNRVKDSIRSWPSWLSQLRSITVKASVEAAAYTIDRNETRKLSCSQSVELNEACSLLSADSTSAYAKLRAIETIAMYGDVSACDFALSLIQIRSQDEFCTSAIITMVIKHYPQRWCELVDKLASQMIVQIVVYCILSVKNGWSCFMEFYFYHCRTPSVLCSLTAEICEEIMYQTTHNHSALHSDIIWENLSQVAALISQSSLLTNKMTERHTSNDFILAQGQETILDRKAFELWQVVLPHFHQIDWDGLVVKLNQNFDYGCDVTLEQTEIFTHLVASRSQSVVLILQVTVRHVTHVHTSNTIDVSLVPKIHRVIQMLEVIAAGHDESASRRSEESRSVSPSLKISPPREVACAVDTAHSLDLSKTALSPGKFLFQEGLNATPDNEYTIYMHACFRLLECLLEATDLVAIRSTMRVMVTFADTTLQLIDSSAKPELTKIFEIMSSTDLSFFSDVADFRELYSLWQLHFENYHICWDPAVFFNHVGGHNFEFIRRWMYVLENNIIDFNPYLIHQHARSQAEMVRNELQQCEMLWKEIVDEDEAAELGNDRDSLAIESRVVELKRCTEKFASSVHKLLTISTCDSGLLSLNKSLHYAKSGKAGHTTNKNECGRDAATLKIVSTENKLRMRLRLKFVSKDYRARNLSSESCVSLLSDTESIEIGRKLSRRICKSMEGVMTNLEYDRRSDVELKHNASLTDAQMRAAIIRSISNPEEYESTYGEISDDDDLGIDETEPNDAAESNKICQLPSGSQPSEIETGTSPSSNFTKVASSGQVNALGFDGAHPGANSTTREQSTASFSPPPVVSYNASSTATNATSFSTLVGGVADYLQKSVKNAKDAVEYGVDSLYTTKDAVSDEAQALVQEVSKYIESTPMTTDRLSPIGSSLQLTMSSLKLIETKPATDIRSPQNFSLPSVTKRSRQICDSGAKNETQTSKVNFIVKTQLVRHLHIVEGKLILTSSSLRFVAERVVDENETVIVEKKEGVPIDKIWRFLFKGRRWKIDDIAGLYRRRYLLKPTALEVFILSTRKNYFFNLISEDVALFHEALMARRPQLLKRHPSVRRLRNPSSLFRNSPMSTRWIQHEISTFEYIMWLNTIAGRTYNDLTQYPVFPWIISDYESATLDLSRIGSYRDLSKPMGALETSRLKFFVDRFVAFEDPDIPKFMYGTHYSNIGAVLYYLIRLEPFTSYALSIQGGKFDHADRLFHSVAETWKNCLTDYTDLKELTPEWFYLPEFLINCNELDFGMRQNGTTVNDVVLPPWARSPEDFVMKNFVALESEYVSANIHHWIDLVFGWKQRGAAAMEANNVFFYLTYEGMVDVDSITDPIVKSSIQSQIAHFGQTPSQLLRDPHPQRQLCKKREWTENLESSEMISPPSFDRYFVLNIPHEAPIVLVKLISGTSLIACVDLNGMISYHRLEPRGSSSHHSDSKSNGKIKSSSSHSDQITKILELQDRKSRKVLGETRILSDQIDVSNSIAFLNQGMVICTVGHHDFSARFHSTEDGALLYRLLQHQSVVSCVNTSKSGLMIALGCTDGTVSVWKVASTNSTMLESLKLFRGTRVSSKPVHASNFSADQVLLGHSAQINCVRVSDELGICISGSTSNECLAHDLEDGAIIHSFRVPGHLEPGVISLDLSILGHVILQSMGTGVPILYSFHLNGSLLAKHLLGDHPMTSLSICARYSQVVVSNSAQALLMTAHTFEDQRVLLDRDMYGEIVAQGLASDERHAIFGVSNGKIVCCPIYPPHMP